MINLIARLFAECPSIKAAMRAGKKTIISARIYRVDRDEWEDLGKVASNEESWGTFLRRAKMTILYRINGRETDKIDV